MQHSSAQDTVTVSQDAAGILTIPPVSQDANLRFQMGVGTTFPTPSQFSQLGLRGSGGRRDHLQKNTAMLATLGRSGSGTDDLRSAAMAVPSSSDTDTPAPPDRLPLDPVSTHRNGTSFVQESGTRLDLYARSAPTGQLAIE